MIFTTIINESVLEWAIDNLDLKEKLGCNEILTKVYKQYIEMILMGFKDKVLFRSIKTDFDENNTDIYSLIECCNEGYAEYRKEMIRRWEESQYPLNNHSPISQEQNDAETREFALNDEVREICKCVKLELKKKGWRVKYGK